jgi:hypothetical protein
MFGDDEDGDPAEETPKKNAPKYFLRACVAIGAHERVAILRFASIGPMQLTLDGHNLDRTASKSVATSIIAPSIACVVSKYCWHGVVSGTQLGRVVRRHGRIYALFQWQHVPLGGLQNWRFAVCSSSRRVVSIWRGRVGRHSITRVTVVAWPLSKRCSGRVVRHARNSHSTAKYTTVPAVGTTIQRP